MRILITMLGAFALSVLLGKVFVPMLRALKAGQSIREVGPKWHSGKQGTPTMGGLIFISASLLCLVTGFRGMLRGDLACLFVLLLSLAFGGIGFVDDFVKVKLKRNLGLTAIQKLVLQLAVAAAFLLALRWHGNLTNDLYIPFFNVTFRINWVVYLFFAVFVNTVQGCAYLQLVRAC